jgi:CHAT domain-containing protein
VALPSTKTIVQRQARSIDDEQASQFMQRFYFHWLKQVRSDPAAALRAAQQEQAAAAKPSTTWTSFILVGG